MRNKQRRTTSIDVARAAGVSQSTVSFVLNNDPRQSISEETRLRVKSVANELGYQPFAPARALRAGINRIVLVVWPELTIETGISMLLEALASVVEKQGFSLILQIGFDAKSDLLAANLSPAVVVWLGDKDDADSMTSLAQLNAPIVTVTGHNWFASGPRLQVDYLAKYGHLPIVFAATDKVQLQSMCNSRINIVRQTCEGYGFAEPRVVTISQVREEARRTMQELIATQSLPFSICAFNDDVAFVCLAALYDLKVAVPEDVSVIGHDNTRIGELCNPPLTTIGASASNLLEQLCASVLSVCQNGPVLEVLTPTSQVIVRSSV